MPFPYRHDATLVLLLLCRSAPVFAQGPPNITDVVNAASKDHRLAPGTLADVIGANLLSGSATTALVGTSNATVISSTSTTWRILIPFGVSPGQTTVQIGASVPFSITLTQYAAGLFSADQSGAGLVAAQDYQLTSVGGLIQPGATVSASSTARLGDILVVFATGLGPIEESNYDETVDNPTAAVAGVPALVLDSSQTQSTSDCLTTAFCIVGMYQVLIVLPPAVPTGNQPIVLSIDGSSSQSLTVPIDNIPIVKLIANAASGNSSSLAPGSLASIYGTTFGTSAVSADPTDFSKGMPTTLDGVSVSFNNIPAPLIYVGTDVRGAFGQINLQVPAELPTSGTVTATVTTSAGTSANYSVQMAPAAPGVFTFPWLLQTDSQLPPEAAVAVANTNWFVMPSALAAEYGMPTNCRAGGVNAAFFCGEPAKRGDSVQIFVTGLGPAAPNGNASQGTLATGQLTPAGGSPLYQTVQTPVVTIGSGAGAVSATVTRSMVVPGYYAGFYRMDIQIPATAPVGDYIPLMVAMPNGGLQDATTTIAIQQ